MRRDRAAEARSWLLQSLAEVEDARELERRGRFYLALFLFQQATEKALKAYLYYQGEEELFTHSVNDLLKLAISYDKEFEKASKAKTLDRYYIPTRYPNGLAGDVPAEFFDDPDECRGARELAMAAIELVKLKIGQVLS
ncbi:MAG: HEPN domain-containing protein [Actinomycetia bacterium]|nr:HEPN domain-containing protein [Actinomycetes bacterium]